MATTVLFAVPLGARHVETQTDFALAEKAGSDLIVLKVNARYCFLQLSTIVELISFKS